MEHREPPRNSRRDRRWVSVRLAGLVVAVAGGFLAGQALVQWLQDQEDYQIPFRSIRLETELPAWYRGEIADFLESVRRCAREAELLPVLRLEPRRLARTFGAHPLVDRDVRVSYPPRGIRVALRFRQPVALVEISATERYLLDETARILPMEEVDLARLRTLEPLIRIWAEGLAGPLTSEPGATWRPKPGVLCLDERNGRIPGAAGLAGFLVRKIRELGPARAPALEILDIVVTDPAAKGRGLFLWNREQTAILWGAAPGEESLGNLTADQKWAALCDWSRRTRHRTLPPGDYWEFTREGRLRPVPTRATAGQTSNQAPTSGKVAGGSG